MKPLIKALATYAHESWARWMNYLLSRSKKNPDGSVTIPAGFVRKWQRQISTSYKDLPPAEKWNSEREANKIIATILSDEELKSILMREIEIWED